MCETKEWVHVKHLPVGFRSRLLLKIENEQKQCIRKGFMMATSCQAPKCKRRVIFTWPFCTQHLHKIAHLQVRKTSLINNATHQPLNFDGLFARCWPVIEALSGPIFKKGDLIIPFYGEVMTPFTFRQLYKEGEYTAVYCAHTQHLVIDAAYVRGVAALANSAHRSSMPLAVNAELVQGNKNQFPSLFAIKDIWDGDEILLDYGSSFWDHYNKNHKYVYTYPKNSASFGFDTTHQQQSVTKPAKKKQKVS